MKFTHDQLMKLLGFEGSDEANNLPHRYKCRLMGALYSCHFWQYADASWKYIGLSAPATALGSVLDLVGGTVTDFENDDEWRRVEGRR